MSGINRFLSRRDRHSSGSQPKKVMPSPSLQLPLPEVEPDPFIPSSSSRSSASIPYSFRSSSSRRSLCLAFQEPVGKCSPVARLTEEYAQSTTANSLGLVLQPRLIITDDPYGLFTPENGDKPTKDEEKKVALRVPHTALRMTHKLSIPPFVDQGITGSTLSDWQQEHQGASD